MQVGCMAMENNVLRKILKIGWERKEPFLAHIIMNNPHIGIKKR